jgi:hypothetical protein
MRHPAETFLKWTLIKDPDTTNAQLEKLLVDSQMLRMPTGEESYYDFLRQDIPVPPVSFDPANRAHRASMQFLREQGVYEMFFPTDAMQEAWTILTDIEQRMVVEQVILSRLPLKDAVYKINKKQNWKMTVDGIEMYRHCFWNVKLLSFDEWGRFLYGRATLYERYMGLLQAPASLAFFHLRIDQTLESKDMIRRAQEIAYHTLEEVSLKPGTSVEKVKCLVGLTKAITDCHEALSTSDMALKDVLQQFEKFRVVHPQIPPPSIQQLAPHGNFTDSGVESEEKSAKKTKN